VIVDRAAAILAQHGIATARTDAEWIVAHVLGVSRSELVAQSHDVDEAAVSALVERRAAREPLAYVLGEWGFRRLTLRCDRRALVPRPETEALVERCTELLRDAAGGTAVRSPRRVLDVGTGTGAIALALADEVEYVQVVATDASADALALAQENAEHLGRDVELVHARLEDGLPPGPFDLIVSNPPYVQASEFQALEPEVRVWEPREALLDEGQTELLARAAIDALRPRAPLVLEIHEEHGERVSDLLESLGYDDVRITRDLAGRDRVVEGKRP
jgi:release factor glutamine methyltransferase